MTDIAQTTVTRTSGAERMKLHRERKRNKMRCLMMELRNEEIDALIAKKFLKPEMRDDREAIAVRFMDGSSKCWCDRGLA